MQDSNNLKIYLLLLVANDIKLSFQLFRIQRVKRNVNESIFEYTFSGNCENERRRRDHSWNNQTLENNVFYVQGSNLVENTVKSEWVSYGISLPSYYV